MNVKPTEEQLGTFAKLTDKLTTCDRNGNAVSEITAGDTIVAGPFKLVTKGQIVRILGVVTASMLNHPADKPTAYRFKGNGWYPLAPVGAILLQDINNPEDCWACPSGLFEGWCGTTSPDGELTYAKRGDPVLAMSIPEGIVVTSLAGRQTAGADCYLTLTDPDVGDFYIWTKDVVEAYVRDYEPAGPKVLGPGSYRAFTPIDGSPCANVQEETTYPGAHRPLGAKDTKDFAAKVSDVTVVGNPDIWQLACKVTSAEAGIMKSTKFMRVPKGVVINVSTRENGSTSEALVFVPGAQISAIHGGSDPGLELTAAPRHFA